MAKPLMAIPLALAVVLGAQSVCLAQAEPMTRAEASIDMTLDTQIADLPAGHWATNATQVAVANNILSLHNGEFDGNQPLTHAQLRQAMNSLVNIAQNIAGEGALPALRAAVGEIPTDTMPVTRLELAQGLSNFLTALNSQELVAIGTSPMQAAKFKDLGPNVPQAVQTVVNKFGVMTGYPDATFRPREEVTRYQMAAIALHIIRDMREAPIAQLPADQPPVVVQPQAPEIVVVTPPEEEEEIVAVPVDLERPYWRQDAPIHVSWQGLGMNAVGNLIGEPVPITGVNTIPGQATFTGYVGPAMLQNVTNFRVSPFESNVLMSDFRLGYSDLIWGPLQFIPFVGVNVGLGTAAMNQAINYTGFVGAGYGAVLSVRPVEQLDLFATFNQSFPLQATRFNTQFQPIGFPEAAGSVLSSYGIGADYYITENFALTAAVSTWQIPGQFFTTGDLATFGVNNVAGGSLGVGFGF